MDDNGELNAPQGEGVAVLSGVIVGEATQIVLGASKALQRGEMWWNNWTPCVVCGRVGTRRSLRLSCVLCSCVRTMSDDARVTVRSVSDALGDHRDVRGIPGSSLGGFPSMGVWRPGWSCGERCMIDG